MILFVVLMLLCFLTGCTESTCDLFYKSVSKRAICYSKVHSETAEQANDITDCETIEGPAKNTCYVNFAEETKDITICEEKVSSLSRNSCMYEVAILTKSVEDCRILQTNAGLTLDVRECFTIAAVAANNLEICNELLEESDQASCIQGFAEEFSDISYCDKIKEEYGTEGQIKSTYELCVLIVARQTMNPELCNELTTYKESCLEQSS